MNCSIPNRYSLHIADEPSTYTVNLNNIMLTCIAIDDEPLALEVIKKYISKIYFLEFKGAFTDPFEAKALLDSTKVDIIS